MGCGASKKNAVLCAVAPADPKSAKAKVQLKDVPAPTAAAPASGAPAEATKEQAAIDEAPPAPSPSPAPAAPPVAAALAPSPAPPADVPEFEVRYWVDVACVPPAFIDGEGLLAPADRFVNDEVPPGTFMDASTLQSPATMLDEVAMTLATDVKANLDRLLPDDFADNAELPVPCAGDLNDDGAVDAADLGIVLSFWGNCL